VGIARRGAGAEVAEQGLQSRFSFGSAVRAQSRHIRTGRTAMKSILASAIAILIVASATSISFAEPARKATSNIQKKYDQTANAIVQNLRG
jgi:hypothetical protein